jgi:cytochrome c oxidase subunit II
MKKAPMRLRRELLALPVVLPVCLLAIAQPAERVLRITTRKFEYEPKEIVLKQGEAVVLELVSLDVAHGFEAPELGLQADVLPGKPARLRLLPQRAGAFGFHCDHFCGDGHEEMEGTITVIA